jgi:hypothetical protein
MTPDRTRDRPVKRRRWHRIAIPFGVVALLYAMSGVSRAWEEPDFGEPGTLSPTGIGPDGSSRLAALLAERNVTIERQTSSMDTVRSAMRGDATVFVPVPKFPNRNLVRILATLPADNRVVLVEPGSRDQAWLPVVTGPSRWAPDTRAPRCADPTAVGAGRATATRTRYMAIDDVFPEAMLGTTDRYTCYHDGLVGLRWRAIELVVIGSSDPFRNSRIDEHGNAALATGLLSARHRVIWLDLHAAEKVSYSVVEADELGLDLPNDSGAPPDASAPSPLWTAVPPVFWPIVTQGALVAVLLALWRARRLGPPVAEPLPILVPAAETVTGRGRLYERADARGPAIDALRAAARQRILPRLDLAPETPEADVVAAVAERTRAPADHVRTVLYGPEPADDDQLVAAATALDALEQSVSIERRMNS